jgi:hypothetical protein
VGGAVALTQSFWNHGIRTVSDSVIIIDRRTACAGANQTD